MASNHADMRRPFVLLAACVALSFTPARVLAYPACAPGSPVTIAGVALPEQERGFVLEPFTIGGGVTKVQGTFTWRTKNPFGEDAPSGSPVRNTLDLGLREPDGTFRGWNATTFQFAADSASRTYHPGPIAPGEWTAEIGVAAVFPGTTAPYTLTITCSDAATGPATEKDPLETGAVRSGPGWYAGDLHVHTANGSWDAPVAATPQAVADFAAESGLDFVSITDHNSDKNFWDLGDVQRANPDVLLIPGTEITTYNGHANAHGQRSWVDYRIGAVWRRLPGGALQPVPWTRTIDDVLGDVRAQGALTQVNHPTQFDDPLTSRTLCRGCAWGYPDTDWSKVDLFEVQTAPPGLMGVPDQTILGPNPFTLTAIRMWEGLLDRGYRITAVGSSDDHRAGNRRASPADGAGWITESVVGVPATVVYADELSEAAILSALAEGHAFVKMWGVAGPDLRLTATSGAASGMMGDALPAGGIATLYLAVTGGPAGQVCNVVHDGAVVATIPVPPGGLTLNLPVPATGRWRIETLAGTSLQAMTNPIYFT